MKEALVVVQGGIARPYVLDGEIDIRVVDIDSIKAGDDLVELPASFDGLVKLAGVEEYTRRRKEAEDEA